MKYLTTLLLSLLSFISFSQDSWMNIQYLSDNYPTEITWEVLDGYGSVVIESDSNYILNSLLDTTIALNASTYTLNLYDISGDGLGASQWNGTDGWFLIQNDCQDTLTFVAGDFGALYTDTLTIAPCAPPAPPVPGCIDTNALNFDPLATINNDSCNYPTCSGVLTSNAYQNCLPNSQAVISFADSTETTSGTYKFEAGNDHPEYHINYTDILALTAEDGKFFTSSGVSAGIDMALAAIANLYGMDKAEETAEGCEYIWNKDAERDPFAKLAGLI